MDPPVSEPACVVVGEETTDSDSFLGTLEFPSLSADVSRRLPVEQPSSSGAQLAKPSSPYSRVAKEYEWVSEEIRGIESYYNSVERMDDFLKDHAITRDPEDDLKVIAIHSSLRSRVCYPAFVDCDLPSFFVYDTFFLRLRLSVPFNDFECSVLRFLRVAPTQLHPVSWGYVKAFQVLMQGFGLDASLGVFFSFFQVKGSYGGKWVSLNVVPRRRLLKPIDSSYKRWKPYFFRISCLDKHTGIFLSEGKPKHPMTWVERPRQFLQYDSRYMTDEEMTVTSFLSEQCTFHKEGEAPHCLDLINLSGHEDRLFSYLGKHLHFSFIYLYRSDCCNSFFFFFFFFLTCLIVDILFFAGTRYPNMDRERLRRLKENIAKGPVKESAAVPAVTIAQAIPVSDRADSEETHESQPLKRQRADKGLSVAIPQTSIPAAVISAIPGLEHLKITSPANLAGVLYAISYADRMAAEYAGSLDSENKAFREKIRELQHKNAEASKIIGRERAALVKRDEDIANKNNEITRLAQELEAAKVKITTLESEVGGAKTELGKYKEEIDVLERGALQNYENGYSEALKHFKHQHPDEDLSIYGVFHEIIDGRLVDPASLKKPSEEGTSAQADPSKASK